jgi:exonuclease SbcD
MIEDQKYILTKILNIIDDEKPSGIIIAGDVYDKSVPSAEAVEVFDDFLTKLASRKYPVFIISGNHDSAERIAFGSKIMDLGGVHMSPVYDGKIEPITLEDEWGQVNIYMLPFVKPANVRRFFPDDDIESYTDALNIAIKNMNVDKSKRNILITHQFVTGALRSDSEDISVGGTDNIDASVFADFDYVALGHIHRPQNVGSEKIRYCGSPLKYSFSEAKFNKSVTVADLKSKDNLEIREIPLIPKYDMTEIKGTFKEITSKDFYTNADFLNNYLRVTLTDEEDIPDGMGKLRQIYQNIMRLDYDNARTRKNNFIDGAEEVEKKSDIELFEELFIKQNNRPMSDEQREFSLKLIEEIAEG